LAHTRSANTLELLDRVTVLRAGMESEALEVMEAELARRGIGPDEIHAHERELRHRVVQREDGLPAQCSFCRRAAVASRTEWHRLWKLIPLFKRRFWYCEGHVPKAGEK
jgi:hypothetical protein